MQTLDVINLMLGTMGELPLNSLEDSHALLPAMQGALDDANRRIQADGWWFNMEDVTLTPNPVDSALYLPNDCLSVRTDKYNLVKRGNRVYNLTGGTYVFTQSQLKVELIREVAFEDLPEIAASYIAAVAILKFQTDYDGDTAKGRQLANEVQTTHIAINVAHTRSRKSNLLLTNYRLQNLKQITRGARRLLGR
jgi:tail tube protein